MIDAADYGHVVDISGEAELAEDNYISLLGPGGTITWQVQIANDHDKLVSDLKSAEVRVHLPTVLRYVDDVVLDEIAATAGATVRGSVDGGDVVFEISAPGISKLGLTFSTVVRDDITQVSAHGTSGDEDGDAAIGQLQVLEASPIDHPDTSLALPPVEASGFYSFQVGPAEALSAGVVRSVGGIIKPDSESGTAQSQASPGDQVGYVAWVEPYAVDGGMTAVEVRITESPDVPFALSPDLSDVSGIETTGGSGDTALPALITRESGTVIVRMVVPSAPTTGAGVSAGVSIPGVVDPFAGPGTVFADIEISATASGGEKLVPGDMTLVSSLLGLPLENGVIPLTITAGTPPTPTPPTVITDNEYYATLLLSASTDNDESGQSPNFYVPVGEAVRWSADIDTNSELLDEGTPSKQFRVEDAVVRIELDPDLVYNGDVTAVDERGRTAAVVGEVVDGELVIRVTGALASRLQITFTTTVGEGLNSIKRISPAYDSGMSVVTPISHVEITSGRPAEAPNSRIALPSRAGYEAYIFQIGPADPFATGVFDWRGWVVGFDGQQLAEVVRPGDQVMYAATGAVSTQTGGSTVVVRIDESEDAPFALPPDLTDPSGILVMAANNEPLAADIHREPGAVTVTVQLPESDPASGTSPFTVLIPGAVDPGAGAAEIVPQISVNGRNAADVPLILGVGVFGSYFPHIGIELPSLSPLPIIRD